MKLLFTLLNFLPFLSLGQTNVLLRTPNSNTPGTYNTLVGGITGNLDMTGAYNSFIGFQAGSYNTTGENNSFVGKHSGFSNNSGNENTFMGFQAGYYNSSGTRNAFFGADAGNNNTTGGGNAFFGPWAGYQNKEGHSNTFIGNSAGQNTENSLDNTFIGAGAGYFQLGGNYNTFIGAQSNFQRNTGSKNTFIGYNTSGTDNITNSCAIGAEASVWVSNAIVLGDYSNTSICVGIGINRPEFPLDIRGIINLRNKGTIKYSHLSNPFLRNGYTDQFLTVNENGETVMARYRLRTESPSDWADKVFEPDYKLQSLSQVEQHIKDNKRLPDMPSAQQVTDEGVDLVKMNALLLQKVEELTLYSIQQQKRMDKQEQRHQQEIDELKQLIKSLKK